MTPDVLTPDEARTLLAQNDPVKSLESRFANTRYKWAGKSTAGADCSGYACDYLASRGYTNLGGRNTADLLPLGNVTFNGKESLRAGDVVVRRSRGPSGRHVAVYTGSDFSEFRGKGQTGARRSNTDSWLKTGEVLAVIRPGAQDSLTPDQARAMLQQQQELTPDQARQLLKTPPITPQDARTARPGVSPTPNTQQQKEAAKVLARLDTVNSKIAAVQKEIADMGRPSMLKASQLRQLMAEREELRKHPIAIAKNLADIGIASTKWSAQDLEVTSARPKFDPLASSGYDFQTEDIGSSFNRAIQPKNYNEWRQRNYSAIAKIPLVGKVINGMGDWMVDIQDKFIAGEPKKAMESLSTGFFGTLKDADIEAALSPSSNMAWDDRVLTLVGALGTAAGMVAPVHGGLPAKKKALVEKVGAEAAEAIIKEAEGLATRADESAPPVSQVAEGPKVSTEPRPTGLDTTSKVTQEPGATPGGSTNEIPLASGVDPNIGKFVKEDVIPAAEAAVKGIGEIAHEAQSTFSPASRGELAGKVANVIRANNAARALAVEKASYKLSKFGKVLDHMDEPSRWQWADDIESGRTPSDPILAEAAAHTRTLLDSARDEIRGLGEGQLENYIENYFPHIWKDPTKAVDVWKSVLGKRPLEGSKSFLKQRTIPTIKEGLAMGLEPVSTSPIELVKLKYADMQRYIMAQKIFSELKDAGLAQYIKHGHPVPDGLFEINDKIARVFSTTDKGMAELGKYYAPESVARILNNFLSPGLGGSTAYQAVRWVGNAMNMAQLGLSGFHAGFVTMDVINSKASLGLKMLDSGDYAGAIKSFMETPASPITTFVKGHRLKRALLTDVGGKYEKALIDAGSRISLDPHYHLQAIKAFKEATRSGNYIGALLRTPYAALELVTYPIMQGLVPRMKLGVFKDMVDFEFRKLGPDATLEQRRAALAKVQDSVDNRLGQLVYDNLFWNKLMKDAGMVTTRALGWNIGDIRELGGGALVDLPKGMANLAKGKRPELTHRLAYTLMLPATTAAASAIYMYLRTGKGPETIEDYFRPRTGETITRRDKKGKVIESEQERVQFPTYMKDVLHVFEDPWGTAKGKAAPWLTELVDQLENTDFWNGHIVNEDDPLIQQWLDRSKHVGKAFIPFSLTSSNRRQNKSVDTLLESLFGLTPVRSKMSQAERVRMEAMKKLKEASVLEGKQSKPTKKYSTPGS